MSTGIGEARRFTRHQLKAWGVVTVADNAILMISELVTNAILHGGEGAVLTLKFDEIKVRAEVRDSSPAVPTLRGYSETATTGRGMVIVDALAAAWGTYAVDGGKVVWFELATADAAPEVVVASERPGAGRPGKERSSGDFKPTTSPPAAELEQFGPRGRRIPAETGARR